jgi:alpha-galactosidase
MELVGLVLRPGPARQLEETRTLKVAQFMHNNLLSTGWTLLTIDEGWAWYGGMQSTNASLDAFGRPVPRPDQYPSAAGGAGFAPLAAQVGALGLDLGVWSMRGIPRAAVAAKMPIADSPYTCDEAVDANRPNVCGWNGYTFGCAVNASTGLCVDAAVAYYKSLALLYVSWGLSFVKVDCMWGGPAPGQYDADLIAFTEAFRDNSRIELSISPGGGVSAANVSFLAENRLAIQTRVTNDFWDDWGSLKTHLAVAEQFEPFFAAADGASFATYPDLDMMPIGDVIVDGRLAPSRFLPSEARLLVTVWAACGAPMILGGDLPPSDPALLALLTNARILQVHDAAHSRRAVRPTAGGADTHAWASAPNEAPAEAYVVLVNAVDPPLPTNVSVALADLPWLSAGAVCATDLWSGAAVPGSFSGDAFFAVVAPHDASAFRLASC